MAVTRAETKRAENLWDAFERKYAPISKSVRFVAAPELGFDQIGGLDAPKEEMLTYAYAATDPDAYARWGTFAPTALLLVGRPGCGKSMLAEAFSHHAEVPFIDVAVPRLVLQVLHASQMIPELLTAWGQVLEELPPTAVFFDELEFTQAEAMGGPRPDLPVGPVMDFLLEMVDRAVLAEGTLVLGSTSSPDSLRAPFLAPGRFERLVEVSVQIPDDVVAALRIHASQSEKRAGRPLFDSVAWDDVVRRYQEASIGEWVRLLHAVLRRKARLDAAEASTTNVTTEDMAEEVERAKRLTNRLPRATGRYL